MNYELILSLICGALIGTAVVYLLLRRRHAAEIHQLQTEKNRLQSQVNDATTARQRAENEVVQARTQLEAQQRAHQQIVDLMNQEKAEGERRQRESMQKAMDIFSARIKEETTEILQTRQQQLQDDNSRQMEAVVKPLRQQLEQMKQDHADSRLDAEKQTTRLETQIRTMFEKTEQLGTRAENLAKALKNNSKVQGDWGEQMLETILQNSGLLKGQEYDTQVALKDKKGQQFRLDVVIHCPGNRDIVVDAKVSLTAYADYVSADSDEEREQARRRNFESVKSQMELLAGKNYQSLDSHFMNTVIMFIPNEGSYLLALQHDYRILQQSLNKGVFIVCPSNFMFTLQIISMLWYNERKEKNVEKILNDASLLYEKFCIFTNKYAQLRNDINRLSRDYDDASNTLSTGKGNILDRFERMKELGSKISDKNIDQKLLD